MTMHLSHKSGIYVVKLKNEYPISVNADRSKIAEKCIQVTKDNCKYGKSKNLSNRKNEYEKTFGKNNVLFIEIAILSIEDIIEIEKEIGNKLSKYRMRGKTGRLNEWLKGIPAEEVMQIAINVLQSSGLKHELLTGII
jgi:hypothetical protein